MKTATLVMKLLMLMFMMVGVRAVCYDTECQTNSSVIEGCVANAKSQKFCPEGGVVYTCCISDSSHQRRASGESGICSWYGSGSRTANGERFNKNAMTAAHKKLKFGTRIRVKNLANGKTVVVRINDRGPFVKGRIVDLTRGAFAKIENLSKGLTKCSYTIL